MIIYHLPPTKGTRNSYWPCPVLPNAKQQQSQAPQAFPKKRKNTMPKFWGWDAASKTQMYPWIYLEKVDVSQMCYSDDEHPNKRIRNYPLQTNIAGWKMDPDWRCISHWEWWFSMAMLVYWTVFPTNLSQDHLYSQPIEDSPCLTLGFGQRRNNYPTYFGFHERMTSWLLLWPVILMSCRTVDGRNPAPVDMVNIQWFTGVYTSQVVQDFFHEQ